MSHQDERLFNVNQHGVVAIAAPIWLGMLFLARQWILGLAALASFFAGQDKVIYAVAAGFDYRLLLMEVPAAGLIWAAMSRQPEHHSLAKRLWHAGPRVAVFVTVLHAAYFAWRWSLDSQFYFRATTTIGFLVLIDTAICLYFLRNPLARQIFSEFPLGPTRQ
jgi:hypothetical protein